MKLLTLLAASLLPAGLLAAPSPDDNDEGGTTGLFSNADGGNQDVEVKKWTVHPCTIVTEKTVNCRAAASTKAPVVAKLPNGLVGGFLCVETGDCVVIGGNKNWYVYFSRRER